MGTLSGVYCKGKVLSWTGGWEGHLSAPGPIGMATPWS